MKGFRTVDLLGVKPAFSLNIRGKRWDVSYFHLSKVKKNHFGVCLIWKSPKGKLFRRIVLDAHAAEEVLLETCLHEVIHAAFLKMPHRQVHSLGEALAQMVLGVGKMLQRRRAFRKVQKS